MNRTTFFAAAYDLARRGLGMLPALRRRMPTFRPFSATLALVLFNVILFEWAWMDGDYTLGRLSDAAGFDAGRIAAGEWLRCVTHAAVHFDWKHLLWNMGFLLLFGLLLEPAIGAFALVASYLAAILASDVTLLYLSTTPGVGASAAVCGVQGAYLAHPIHVDKRGRRWLNPIWLLAAAYTGMDLWSKPAPAHVAGLLAGLWCGVMFRRRRGAPLWSPTRRGAFAAFSVTIGLLAALAPDNDWWLTWNVNRARAADGRGDHAGAARHVEAVIRDADSESWFDSWAIYDAVTLREKPEDPDRVRQLLAEIAPTLESAPVYRDLASAHMRRDPPDRAAAEAALRSALESSPSDPEALHMLAKLYFDTDTSRVQLARTRMLARNAVRNAWEFSPPFEKTLAWCDFRSGDVDKALRRMRRVVQMNEAESIRSESDLADLSAMEAEAAGLYEY